MLVHPRLPRGLGAGDRGRRLITVEIEADRQVDLVTHWVGNEMGDAGRRLVKPEEQLFWPRGLARPCHDSRERWRALRRAHPLAHLGAFHLQPEPAGQRLPGLGLRLWGDTHQLERGAGLATEVFEIEPQDAEE